MENKNIINNLFEAIENSNLPDKEELKAEANSLIDCFISYFILVSREQLIYSATPADKQNNGIMKMKNKMRSEAHDSCIMACKRLNDISEKVNTAPFANFDTDDRRKVAEFAGYIASSMYFSNINCNDSLASWLSFSGTKQYDLGNNYCRRVIGSENCRLNKDKHILELAMELATSISGSFYNGELPYVFYRQIQKCLFEYNFSPEIVYQLFSVCFDWKKHRSVLALQYVALKWYESGYTTDASLKKNFSRVEKIAKSCCKHMRKMINDKDLKLIIIWIEDYDVSEELVETAFKVNGSNADLTLNIIGDTLAKWHESE